MQVPCLFNNYCDHAILMGSYQDEKYLIFLKYFKNYSSSMGTEIAQRLILHKIEGKMISLLYTEVIN